MRKLLKLVGIACAVLVCLTLTTMAVSTSPIGHRLIWHPFYDSLYSHLAVVNLSPRKADVICATREIAAGETVTENSVDVEDRSYDNYFPASSSSWFYFPDEVVGRTVKRTIAKGSIVRNADLNSDQ